MQDPTPDPLPNARPGPLPDAPVFVTGATGLLGVNLVREMLDRGLRVRALARDPSKAARLLPAVPGLEIVRGDMRDTAGFARALRGCGALIHAAAYFRDSYSGGGHWPALKQVNVDGTASLLEAAYEAGIRRAVHVSSIAVLRGEPGQRIDESMERAEADADDYYRSKILADRAVFAWLDRRPDAHASLVLPGWMHGPYDAGPTAGGRFAMDFADGRMPATPPGSFAFVDARDVAAAILSAAENGRRGVRYLAAGRHMTVREIAKGYAAVTGRKVPGSAPMGAVMALALAQEGWARLTGRPVLLSLASARALRDEADRSRYDHARSKAELGVRFRPVERTMRDELEWLAGAGMIKPLTLTPEGAGKGGRRRKAG
ncbi:MAG: SDR family oxidoreductase [Pseudomonadota bacterium]|nr:SDR family oxidoreductase [Pseudomonadota bacterium]